MSEKECSVSLYPADTRKCLCKGTVLIGSGKNKSFCPTYRVQRYWPQQQEDGSIEFKKLGNWGIR